VVAILSPLSLYGGHRKTKLPLLHNTRIYAPKGTLGILVVAPSDGCLATSTHLASTQALRSRLVSSASKSLDSPGSISVRRASDFGFVAQPSNPDGFVVNCRKPRGLGAASTPVPLMNWLPRCPGSILVLRLNQETIPDFVLLFLPQCGPQLISFGHRVRRAEPTCLSTPRRPHRLRPFAPILHLHQRKSNRNLHLQYSTKSQSTPHYQSLITLRSDHPPVVGRSGPR
jgi:hypothetical protein